MPPCLPTWVFSGPMNFVSCSNAKSFSFDSGTSFGMCFRCYRWYRWRRLRSPVFVGLLVFALGCSLVKVNVSSDLKTTSSVALAQLACSLGCVNVSSTLKTTSSVAFITRPICALDRFQRQVFKHVPECNWTPFAKTQWIPRKNICNIFFVGILVFCVFRNRRIWVVDPKSANVSGFR